MSTRGISDLERGRAALPRRDTLRRWLDDARALRRAARRAAGGRTATGRAIATGDAADAAPALPVPLTPLIGREAEIGRAVAVCCAPDVRC